MASLKLSIFEERQNDKLASQHEIAVETRIMRLDNCRCHVAKFVRELLGKNAKVSFGKGRIEIRSRRPLRKDGAVAVWGLAVVSMNDGPAYELTVMAEYLSTALSAVE